MFSLLRRLTKSTDHFNALNEYVFRTKGIFEVDIFSLSGKLIISNIAQGGQINISSLKSGVYLINIESSYGNTTKKLIVN